MYIEFDKEYLRELYTDGCTSDKKHRFQPEVIRGYQKVVLQGDKKGISSVRVNKKYRLEFTVKEEGNEKIVTFCRLLEISNHYK